MGRYQRGAPQDTSISNFFLNPDFDALYKGTRNLFGGWYNLPESCWPLSRHSIERDVAFGFDWELHGRQEDERRKFYTPA
jgi:hypothetical protein